MSRNKNKNRPRKAKPGPPTVVFLVWDQRFPSDPDKATCIAVCNNSREAAEMAIDYGGLVAEHHYINPGLSRQLDEGVLREDLSPPPFGTFNAEKAQQKGRKSKCQPASKI